MRNGHKTLSLGYRVPEHLPLLSLKIAQVISCLMIVRAIIVKTQNHISFTGQ
jgi:hypothetical protein